MRLIFIKSGLKLYVNASYLCVCPEILVRRPSGEVSESRRQEQGMWRAVLPSQSGWVLPVLAGQALQWVLPVTPGAATKLKIWV